MEFTDLEHPRIGNTGVQNTRDGSEPNNAKLFYTDYAEKGELKSLIDWCEFTIPIHYPLSKVYEILGIPDSNFTLLNNGKRLLGYSETYVNGSIKVLTAGSPQMGHHVLMTGQACREYELYVGLRWKDLLQGVLLCGGKFSRLDVAIDDFKGYFMIKDCYDKLISGEVSSKFKDARKMEKIRIVDGYIRGMTLYFGSEKSELQIRMYEKNFEQDMQEDIEIWNRTELQLRNDRALQFAQAFVSDDKTVGEYASMVLKNYLNFLDRSESDSNKARWNVSQFWLDFLGDVEKLKLTTKKPDRSIEKTETWLYRQVSKAMALIATVKPEEITKLILDGQQKFELEDELLIGRYLDQQQKLRARLKQKKDEKKINLLKPRRLSNN